MRLIKIISPLSYLMLAKLSFASPVDTTADKLVEKTSDSDFSDQSNLILGFLASGTESLAKNDDEVTGFENMDYHDLEVALAAELFDMNQLAKHLNSANAEEEEGETGEIDGDGRLARSTSVESRLLRQKYSNKGKSSRQPRWMRLAREMKRRNKM